MDFKQFSHFCADYEKSFQLICKHVQNNIIDTSKINKEKVYERFITAFNKDYASK